jgi:YfiH family protein
MSFLQKDELKYYSFDLFHGEALVHGVFTRHGGVSPAPWNSLNTGGMNGDKRENVIENRRRIFSVFNRPVQTIFDVWQVHSADVLVADYPRPLDHPHEKADAIVTDNPTITLFMRFGDCVPILLFDPVRKVIGIAHAGWQGTVRKIARSTVENMNLHFGCDPKNILAGIGPSIGVDRYEVGEDVTAVVMQSFGKTSDVCLVSRNGKTHFDLWKANAILLEEAGLIQSHIQISAICTASNPEDWYSHRTEKGKTGRFGTLIGLQ